MNRAERRSVGRLPVTVTPWEVALIDVPVTIDGVDTEGLFIVAEQGSGLVRAAGPLVRGHSLWSLLGDAFLRPPAPCSPARPPRLLCPDPALIRRLGEELRASGIAIDRVDQVPAVDEVVAALRAHLAPVTAPGITAETKLWASALETFARLALWRAVSDRVLFRFGAGVPELRDAVVVVLGQAGEQVGVAVYPTAEDHRRFLDAAVGGDVEALGDVEAMNLYLDPLAELEPKEVAACRAAGLVTKGGLCPRVLVLAGGFARPASERAQRVLLAVVQAISVLAAGGGADLELAPATRVASTCLGALEVRSTPPQREHESFLVDTDYGLGVGRIRSLDDGMERTALVVKLLKRDAERLKARLSGVDRLELVPIATGHVVRVWAGSSELGALVRLRTGEDAAQLMDAERVMLCVSGGGAKRSRIRPEEFVLMADVAVGAAREEARLRHDPVFDRPVSKWPKGSETLLRFAEPVLGEPSLFPVEVLGQALETATTVWNAVVMADFVHDQRFLDDLRRAMAKGPKETRAIIEALIARKRSAFRGDPRILGPVRVELKGSEPRVFVETRLPPGYTVGGAKK